MLDKQRPDERLASLISRMRCTKCRNLPPDVDAKIGFQIVSRHEKPIGVAGDRIYKIGMT